MQPNDKTTDASPKDINGFNIKINEFGEVVCTHDMDDINTFLDKNVVDKKLVDREDLKQK